MNGTFYHLISGYAKSYLLTIFMVSNIALLSTLAKSGHFYESSSKKVANFAEKSKNISVSDSILSFDEAEILEGSINFIEMEKEIAANLNLSPQDGELYWQYLQSQIHQDKLDFLNGGYKSYTASGFPNYVTAITQSYINQYAAFLPNKAAFELQMAEQNALNNVQAVPVGPCTNMGFTNGLTGWTVRNGDAATTCITNAPAAPCAGAAGQAATPRVTVKAAGFDPIVPTLPLVPPGATNSAMIEDYLNGGHISMLSQTFAVTATNNVFTYKYAVVLENPIGGHTYNQRPFFKVTMSASTSGNIQCGDYYQVVDPPFVSGFDSMKVVDPYKAQDPVNDPDNNPMDIYYRPWTTITIPLQAYVGQNVTVTFIASDCEPGGHRGYAYVWAECSALPPIQTSSICLSEVLSYTVPAGFQSYKWEGPGIVGRTDTSIVKVDQPGNYDLILTSIPTTDTTLPCYDTLKFIVLQHCAPPPIDTALCETVQGSGTTTGVNLNNYNTKITAFNPTGTVQGWYSGKPATTANKIATPTNVTVSNGGKYYAVITYPTIGGDTAELDFVVNPLPVINFPAISPLCQGGPAYQITGVTPGGGTFSGTNVTATGLFTPSAVGSYTIKYVYTNANGCTNSATQTIVVNPPPTATAANQTVCSTVSTISLSGTVTNASGEKWIGGSGSFSNSAILTPTYTPTATELAGTSIKLDLIALPLSGCSADTQKITITVVAAPKVTAHDTTICATTSSIVITRATENNAASIAWSAPSGSFSNTSILASTYTPTITTGSVILTLTGNANSPCANTSTTMNVTVVPAPKVTVHDTTVCSIPTITINTATASNTASVVWSGAGTFGNANSLVTTYTPPSITSGTVTLKLTGNANSPCANTSTTMNVTVVPAPVVTVADTTICSTTSSIVIARVTESNAASIAWSAPSGSFSNTSILASTYTPTITTGSVILTLKGNANSPCANTSATMKVTVVPAPVVSATDTTICFTTPYITTNAKASNVASVVWKDNSNTGTFGNINSLATIYTPTITSGSVTLTLTGVANAPCANVTATAKVTVIPAPKVTTSDTIICATTSSITITSANAINTSSVKWSAPSGSFGNASALSTTYIPSISSGLVTLTLESNANAPCANTSATMNVIVVSAPKVTATDTTICSTIPSITIVRATEKNTAAITWSASSDSGVFVNNSILETIFTPSFTSGTVTLTLTGDANLPCANVSATMKVTVIATPKVTVHDTVICSTTPSVTINTASQSNTTSLIWKDESATGAFNNTGLLSPTYTPTITSGSVWLVLIGVANSPCANVKDSMTVTVIAAPKVTAHDTTVCSVPTIIINDATETNTASVAWSGPGTFGSANSIVTTYTPPSITSGTVKLILTGIANSPCANVKDSMLVTVIPSPVVTVTDTTVCSTTHSISIANATAIDTSSVAWSAPSGSFSNVSSLITTYTLPAITSGTVTLTLLGNAVSPCKNVKDSMIVKVIPAPIVNAGPDQTVCSSSPAVTLAGDTLYVKAFSWSNGTGTITSVSNLQAGYTPSSTEIAAGKATLVLTDTALTPCANITDTISITIIQAPQVNAGPNQTVCATSPAVILAGDTLHVKGFSWGNGTGTFTSVSNLQAGYTPSSTEIAAGKATLILTDMALTPCTNSTDTMSITIIPPPVVNAGPDQVVCLTSALVTLAGDTSNVSGFSWSPVNTLTGGTFASSTILNPQYTPSNADILNGQAVLVLTGMGIVPCASVTDSVSIINIPLPIIQVNDTAVCTGQPAVLKAHVLNRPFFQKYNLTLDWSWQIGATAAPSQDSVLTTKTGGVYHITANASGCTGTDSGTVTLYPLPLANLPASVKFCPDTLSEYPLNAGTGSTYKYFWIPTNDTVSQIYVSAPGEYIVTITTKHNCTASSKTIVQEVCPPRLYISSAFSPNSDGSNDIYDVYSAHVGAFHMLIFNRWGEVIFESQDKNHFWNGVYREDPMPIGVYPWVITYEGDTEEYKGPYNMKGSVTVVR